MGLLERLIEDDSINFGTMANLWMDGEPLASVAARTGNLAVIKKLQEKGKLNPRSTALQGAAENGYPDIVLMLLGHMSDAEIRASLSYIETWTGRMPEEIQKLEREQWRRSFQRFSRRGRDDMYDCDDDFSFDFCDEQRKLDEKKSRYPRMMQSLDLINRWLHGWRGWGDELKQMQLCGVLSTVFEKQGLDGAHPAQLLAHNLLSADAEHGDQPLFRAGRPSTHGLYHDPQTSTAKSGPRFSPPPRT